MPVAQLIDDVDTRVPPKGPVTEDQFVEWCMEKTRAEWVDGEIIIMSPASTSHVSWSIWLHTVISLYSDQLDLGKIYGTEFFVRFPTQRRRRLPDVAFVAKDRLSIVKKTFIEGAPDLAMELVSPDSVTRDWEDKFVEYEKAGVREYWIIDRSAKRMEAFALNKSAKYASIAENGGKIPASVLPGFYLRPIWFWQEQLPYPIQVLKEMGVKF